MDASDYDTNAIVVEGITAVRCKTFISEHSTNGAAYSHLAKFATSCRAAGALVHIDLRQPALWAFQLDGKDGMVLGSLQNADDALQAFDHRSELRTGVESSFDLMTLVRGKTTPSTTPTSGGPFSSPAGGLTLPGFTSSGLPQSPVTGIQQPTASSAQTASVSQDDPIIVYKHLLSALQARVTDILYERYQAIAIAPSCYLLPSRLAYGGDTKAREYEFGAKVQWRLLSTGILIASAVVKRLEGCITSIDRSNASVAGAMALITPLGHLGKIQAFDMPKHASLGDAVSPWQVLMEDVLPSRSVPEGQDHADPWIRLVVCLQAQMNVQAEDNPFEMTAFSWPASRCYVSKQFAQSAKIAGEVDALRAVQMWSTAEAERARVVTQRVKAREEALATDTVVTETENGNAPVQSPAAFRRPSASHNAAATAVYPTPPDGIHASNGMTPAIEGAFASPDTSMAGAADGHGSGSTSGKLNNEQSQNGELVSIPEVAETTIFDAFNDDPFASNDITDADFNFFDEDLDTMDVTPPEVAQGPAVDDADLPTPGLAAIKDESTPEMHAVETTTAVTEKPVFIKPELPHVRFGTSSKRDGEASTDPRLHENIRPGSSPFNKATVFKRLRASLGSQHARPLDDISGQAAQNGTNCMDISTRSQLVNSRKYMATGRYGLPQTPKKVSKDQLRKSPRSRSPRKRLPQQRAASNKTCRNVTTFIARVAVPSFSTASENAPPDAPMDMAENSSTSSSDVDGMSDTDDTALSPSAQSILAVLDFADEASEKSPGQPAQVTNTGDATDVANVLAKLALTHPSTDPVATLIACDGFDAVSQLVYSDAELILIAQVLSDQAVSGSLRLAALDNLDVPDSLQNRRVALASRNIRNMLSDSLASMGSAVGSTSLREFLAIQDTVSATPSARPVPRIPGGPEKMHSLVRLPTHHIEVRRHGSKLSILPTAVDFWDSLGLAPLQGNKNVRAVCAFRGADGLADHVGTFLSRLGDTYESMRLGSFDCKASAYSVLQIFDEFHKTSSADEAETSGASSLDSVLATLASSFAMDHTPSTNFVVILLYDPTDPSTIVHCCAAFQKMVESYRSKPARDHRAAEGEIVLQLLPLDLIGSATTLAVPGSTEFAQPCLEIYDRCVASDSAVPAPAMVLEHVLSKPIEFQLKATPTQSVIRENSCVHIAYTQSIGERWVTAAWTDNRGTKQLTASYCLCARGKPLTTTLTEVAQEIWETTLELIANWNVHSRVVITKCGVMTDAEVKAWSRLPQINEGKPSASLVLMSVDTSPSLQLLPPHVVVPSTASAGLLTTPVSTPQPSVSSPEQAHTPATPSMAHTALDPATPAAETAAETDPETILVDVNDTTWGAILSHKIVVPNIWPEPATPLATGYLIQRGGPRVEDPPVVMEVNLVHCEGNPRVHDMALREMLTQFRGLKDLAKARSVIGKEGDVRPWHVAAVEKAIYVLQKLL